MSQSFSEPSGAEPAESDVSENEDQVEPGSDSEYVGRVAGDDDGATEEQGAEARSQQRDNR
jgi:hypothetical protein